MQIQHRTGPPADTHGYLLFDQDSGEAWIVDAPLDTFDAHSREAEQHGCRISLVILTHGHFDHLLDYPAVRRSGVPVAMHPGDHLLLSAPQTLLFGVQHPMPDVKVDRLLQDGEELHLGEVCWKVLHTPGHSPGHVCLYSAANRVLLGGDLLFAGGYGRIDLPGSDGADMRRSLSALLELPSGTRVLPGHGPETTIAREEGWLRPLLDDPAHWIHG